LIDGGPVSLTVSVSPGSLRSFTIGGGAGVFVDAVAQEQKKAHARRGYAGDDQRYSAPINDHRAAVPTYPQLADPTVQPPEQSPAPGPAPDLLYSATGAAGGAATGHSGTRGPVTGGPGGGSSHGGGHVGVQAT
jgi:hypothetical protein